MTFGERKDRVLLVITVITALFFAGTYVAKLMMFLFSSLYIEGFPLSAEHLVAPVMLTSGVFILFSCLKYIYREYFTFANYGAKLGVAKERMDKANESYAALLNMVRFCIALTVGSFIVLFLVSYSTRLLYLIGILIVLVVLLRIIVLWKKKLRSEIMVFLRTYFWNKNAGVVVVWVGIALLTSLMALALFLANMTETLTVTFETKDQPMMQIDFLNKIPEYITVTSYNEDADAKIQDVVPREDFNMTFVAEVSKPTSQPLNSFQRILRDEEKNQSNYNRNLFKYKKSLDLTPYLREGRNFIEITFAMKGLSGREQEYQMVNEILKTKGRVMFVEKELSADL